MADGDLSIHFNKPRTLANETTQSLNQWKATAEVYYCREKYFEDFFDATERWNLSHATYGFRDEDAGLRRTAAKKAKHLKYLLTLLSGYVPWEHLQYKLLHQTTCIADVWKCFYKAFDCVSTNERFLDFNKISKTPTESYLTFYERMGDDKFHSLLEPQLRHLGFSSLQS